MKKGFTLIEIMTAVSIFLVIMTVSMGAILSVFDANRKSESLKTVMDNLNLALESMSREMRFGKNYHCEVDPDTAAPLTAPKNCTAGGKLLSFLASDGTQITYRVEGVNLQKSTAGGPYIAVTAPEIVIDPTSFNFYLTGADPVSKGDFLQPKILIKIRGSAGTSTNQSSFSVQTVVSQRLLDNS